MSLPPPSEGTQPAPKTPQKNPNIWALASITYGIVIALTMVSILAYYYLAPKGTGSQPGDAMRSVTVGSVWIEVYPGATVQATASTKRENVTESTLNFETKDPAGRVLSFYQSALRKGVFRFDTVTRNAGGGTIRSLAHQGKTNVLVTVQTAGEGSRGEIRTVDTDTGDKDPRN
jgi:hypothetical protein